MKQADVQVGKVYAAKVSGSLQKVRITRVYEKWDSLAGPNRGGRQGRGQMRWRADGVNLRTGRTILIKGAARLRWEVKPKT